jgi:membrane dipeptidase
MNQADPVKLHQRAIVIDAVSPLMGQPDHWDQWIRGGSTVAAPTVASSEDSRSAFAKIAKWLRWLRDHSDRLRHVTQVADVADAKRTGKLGVLFHFQDTMPIERDLGLIDVYHRLGVRMIQLSYNQKNFVGDGCSERTDAGLSDFGVSVVHELNRVGVVVDCSHTGYRTTMEAIDISEKPPVFSHSNALALCDNRRNIRDDQIKAVAAKRGLVGITGFPAFVKRDRQPTLGDFVDHIDYVVQLVGIDHVGLGLEYYGQDTPAEYADAVRLGRWRPEDVPPPPHIFPTGIEDATGFPNLTAELLARGYAEADVLRVLGGNWLRVFNEVWPAASQSADDQPAAVQLAPLSPGRR